MQHESSVLLDLYTAKWISVLLDIFSRQCHVLKCVSISVNHWELKVKACPGNEMQFYFRSPALNCSVKTHVKAPAHILQQHTEISHSLPTYLRHMLHLTDTCKQTRLHKQEKKKSSVNSANIQLSWHELLKAQSFHHSDHFGSFLSSWNSSNMSIIARRILFPKRWESWRNMGTGKK